MPPPTRQRACQFLLCHVVCRLDAHHVRDSTLAPGRPVLVPSWNKCHNWHHQLKINSLASLRSKTHSGPARRQLSDLRSQAERRPVDQPVCSRVLSQGRSQRWHSMLTQRAENGSHGRRQLDERPAGGPHAWCARQRNCRR
jgi:hypothetical protein